MTRTSTLITSGPFLLRDISVALPKNMMAMVYGENPACMPEKNYS
jgi:hypothetical protein